jgi:peptidoglycan/LPS O-acetylase OafA/YrhL
VTATGGAPIEPTVVAPVPSTPSVLQAGEVRSSRIESLRAVAALSVLVGHIWLFSHLAAGPLGLQGTLLRRMLLGGGLGVQLFFALSGYLIYRPFARRDFGDATSDVDLAVYARNRAVRILPLYWSAVVILLLLTQHGGTANQWWRFLTFSESYSLSTAQTVDGPMWSLVIEVQFYVVLPLLAWALAKASRRSVLAATTILLALGTASAVFWFLQLRPSFVYQYSFPATFYGFVPGMVTALLQVRLRSRRPWSWLEPLLQRDLWVVGGVVLWIVTCWRLSWEPPFISAASFLVVGAVVLPLRGGRLLRVLDFRPLALLGIASYSLYIWHVPILQQLVPADFHVSMWWLFAAGLPASVVAAALSYAVIERPALKLRGIWASPRTSRRVEVATAAG